MMCCVSFNEFYNKYNNYKYVEIKIINTGLNKELGIILYSVIIKRFW